MAGIKANSATKTMGDGDTAADKIVTGYLQNEQIALTTTPAGSSWVWAIAKPSGATVRSDLSSTDVAGPVFTPDVAGIWTVTVTVDSTTSYVIRITVAAISVTHVAQCFRGTPVANATVPAPPVGESQFFSSENGCWSAKDASNNVRPMDPTARAGTFTLSSGSATITNSTVTANTVVVANCTSASNRGTLTYAVTPGTEIVVTSSNGSDASVYSYQLIG